MKLLTSVTLWNDAVGMRISMTYSEVDESTGKIISDNNRVDRVVTAAEGRQLLTSVLEYAQSFIDAL